MRDQSNRTTDTDVVTVLRREHDRIRVLLSSVTAGGTRDRSEERWESFSALSDLLVRHEVAEELVVYPALSGRRGGDAVSRSRLADQAAIEAFLVNLDRGRFASPDFERDLVGLGLRVLAHLDKEEAQVLPLLATVVSTHRRAELGRSYLDAVSLACAPPGVGGVPSGPAVVDRTTAVATFMRDSVGMSELAG